MEKSNADRFVECVPNFSEGRRSDIIDQLARALESVGGVHVLDVQSDRDHNRTVITMVGSPEAVAEAAFAGIARAAALIDMDRHQGEHPRIGAADVVPFVPLRGVTMNDCVQLARGVGKRVGEELSIPVYLYAEAATRPDRFDLANIRRGQYEVLKAEIETDPDRAPDFGPARLGPSGATAIGARPYLIAFNVYLTTSDVEIARQIARAVRHSSGGLPHVKALGLMVQGRAQVSMNLTDFRQTSIYRVFESVRREADRRGITISQGEIVGLVPQQALLDAAASYLQLDLAPDQILESRLQAMESARAAGPPTGFLDAVAADTPAPGGGSVAALAGALAAALGAMVGRLTVGRPKYDAVQADMQQLVDEADQLRAKLTSQIAEDAVAYEKVVAAYKLSKATRQEQSTRKAAIQSALLRAAEVPLATAQDAVAVLDVASRAARLGNANALSDAGTAAHLARAAFEGAALMVRVNADGLADRERAQMWLAQLDRLRVQCEAILSETLRHVEERW